MEMKRELSDEELGAVTGGFYTSEAQAWLDRNWSTISGRADPRKLLTFQSCMNFCESCEIDLPQLKKLLSQITNVSDLT